MKVLYLIVVFCSVYGLNTFAQGPKSESVRNDGNRPNKIHYTVKRSSLSSDDHVDFGAYVSNNKLYFLSDRKEWPVEWKDENQQPFLDLFVVDLKSGLKTEFAGPKKNGRLNEGPICFNKDGSRVYYTRDYDAKKAQQGEDGMIHLGIFTAKVKGDKWIEEKELAINNRDYSVGHPVLTNDGKYLIFSSNRPGGKGGSDLYRAAITSDGNVGEIEALPGEVNTPGNELFPSIGSNDELYFSSTGHESIGGLDIFMALFKGDFYVRVSNVGHPVNSTEDDFAYSPGESSKGYFSTNRDGNDDIYSFDQVIPFRFVPLLSGELTMEEVSSKDGVLVEVLDENENVLQSQLTDKKGIYSLDLQDDQNYFIRYSMEGYDTKIIKASTKGSGFGLSNDFQLKKDNGIEIELMLFATKTGLAVEGATVTMTDNLTNRTFLREMSDHTGMVSEPMLELKEGDSLDLTVKIAKEGYLTKEVNFKHKVTTMKDIALHEIYGNALKMNRVGIAMGVDVGEMIDVEQLYFVENDFSISVSAGKELDKVVAFMNENPEISISIRAHTDSRGSSSDNLTISAKRARAAMEYLTSKGIPGRRIASKGFGEKEIINRCVDGVDCLDQEHEENNRIEYIIIKN